MRRTPNVQLDEVHSALAIATLSKAHPSPISAQRPLVCL